MGPKYEKQKAGSLLKRRPCLTLKKRSTLGFPTKIARRAHNLDFQVIFMPVAQEGQKPYTIRQKHI